MAAVSSLLLVEDDPVVAEAMHLALTDLGHRVTPASSAEDAERRLASGTSVDLAIVDVMLPGADGFALCRRLISAHLPVILLTARSDAVDVVVGLECGADDYVVKPVEPRVLDARVKAVLRRATTPAAAVTSRRFGALRVDEAAMRVELDGRQVHLTPTELRLLLDLVRHAGHVRTRPALLSEVWEYGFAGDTRLVDACVQRLRSKIEADPARPTLVVTVRGVGYRLETN